MAVSEREIKRKSARNGSPPAGNFVGWLAGDVFVFALNAAKSSSMAQHTARSVDDFALFAK